MNGHSPYDPPKSVVGDSPGAPIPTTPLMQIVRWVLILPAAIFSWYLALIVGGILYAVVDGMCRSGPLTCYPPWFAVAKYGAVTAGAALAATLIMIASTWLAPTHKRVVAIVTFVLGTVVAVFMGMNVGDRGILIPMAAAIAAGGVVLLIVLRRHAPRRTLAR